LLLVPDNFLSLRAEHLRLAVIQKRFLCLKPKEIEFPEDEISTVKRESAHTLFFRSSSSALAVLTFSPSSSSFSAVCIASRSIAAPIRSSVMCFCLNV
jgi:hypothetical protein